ncbi:MAG: iron-containing alcohol dehydrogenase [Atopobiaceae bacterium]|nr:iron-containing alcohol dehydrogenase [Atopobiaceae bacterium]
MNFYMPTRLYTGSGCIAAHSQELLPLGANCLIVTGKHAAKASGALDDVQAALAESGITSVVWDGVTENPPVAACIEAGRTAADQGAQFILGIGGGSALDAAKAVAVFAANPSLDEAGFYAMAWNRNPLPIVLVGTTAGTGSEVTKVSVLTDSAKHKHSIHDDRLYAALAFGDSRHTHSCSRAVTLSTGVDVLAHAAESYFSRKSDEISRAFSTRAIRLAMAPLAAAAANETLTDEQRRNLYEASILGGLAINTTGTCFPHNVGYYLTENYGVPHGFACATFLPQMFGIVRAYDAAYADAFYDEVGTDPKSLDQLIASCMPTSDIHMTEDEIAAALPRWENNGSVKNTRADVTVDMIADILGSLFVH